MNVIRLLPAGAAFLCCGVAAAQTGPVVVSIKPVHSLVASVMGDVGTPELLVEGASSPHIYSLTPSEAQMLSEAGVIFWVGEDLESFLTDRIETLSADATVVELSESPGLVLHDFREGGAFEAHGDHGDHADHDDHDDHDHEEHADHDDHDHEEHADHDDHDHEEHAEADHDDHDHDDHGDEEHADHDDHDHEEHAEHDDHGHDDHAGHDHGEVDMHVWLDPENAKAMVQTIASTLSEWDPGNAATYAANADSTVAQLESMSGDISAKLEPVADTPFVVFHDAYQYFERRYGLTAVGSITVSPEVLPGARRLAEIKEKLGETEAACVMSEPQFSPRLVDVVTEGTTASKGVLDPLGAELDPGPGLYFELLNAMADSLAECLSADS